MDDLPKELKFLVFDYLDPEDMDYDIFRSNLLRSYTKISFWTKQKSDFDNLAHYNKKRLQILIIGNSYDELKSFDINPLLHNFLNLRELACSGCTQLQYIPKELVKLKTLICDRCIFLRQIPKELVNLTLLHCNGCSQIKEVPKELINITELCCDECQLICEIPKELTNLTQLNCGCCPLIIDIPKELTNLKYLHCSWCPKLTKISKELINLEVLACFECQLINEIPRELVNLTVLHCFGLRQYVREVPIESSIKKLYVNGNMLTFFNLFVIMSR